MGDTELLFKGNSSLESTFDLFSLRGVRVLSVEGTVVGRVIGIRSVQDSKDVEGILVSRGPFKSKVYIGARYIGKIAEDAVVLSISPVMFLRGTKVLSADGEYLGVVSEVIRKGTSNDLDALILKRRWCKPVEVPSSAIKKIAQSIILESKYNVDKTYFWQRSK